MTLGIGVQMKWNRLGPSQVRICVECSHEFPSTSSGERTCPSCSKLLSASRARTSVSSSTKQLKDAVHEIFDNDIVSKLKYAQIFDRRKAYLKALRYEEDGAYKKRLEERIEYLSKQLNQVGEFNVDDEEDEHDILPLPARPGQGKVRGGSSQEV